MKPTHFLASILAFGMLLSSCRKENTTSGFTNADSMAVAKSGMIGVAFFKISGGQLRQDTTAGFYEEKQYDIVLSAEKYDAMNSVMQRIPEKLLDYNGAQYTKGRYEDCTNYHITVWKNGKEYKWSISECAESAPKYANQFADEIGQAVSIAEE